VGARKFGLTQVRALTEVLRETGIDASYSVHLTVSGVRGATFIVPNPNALLRGQESPFPIQRDVLSFVDVLLTESDIALPQLEVALKPTLDQLFQTAGLAYAPTFKIEGSLITW
jgi:hypothetical protein